MHRCWSALCLVLCLSACQSAAPLAPGSVSPSPSAETTSPAPAPSAIGGPPSVAVSAGPGSPDTPRLSPRWEISGAYVPGITGSLPVDQRAYLSLSAATSQVGADGLTYTLPAQPWRDAAGAVVSGPVQLPESWQIAVYALNDQGQRYGAALARTTHTGAFGQIHWNGVSEAGVALREGRYEIVATPQGFPLPPLRDPLLLLNTPLPQDAPPPEYATDHLLARFRDADLAARSYTLTRSDAAGWSQVAVPGDASEPEARQAALLALAQRLHNDPNVLLAEPDLQLELGWLPNDPRLGEQYALSKVQAEAAWDIEQGQAEVVVAIVDTGIEPNHPDLRGKVLPGWNTLNNSANARDDHGHGTHCAGIAAASTNNGAGVAGLAPGVRLLPVKSLNAQGQGSSSAIADGIRWAADQGAEVINLSLGASMGSEIIREAIVYAIGKGATVLAAMGNDGGQVRSYPAAFAPNVAGLVAVGATDSGDGRAYFSNYGSWITVSAPGDRILSTLPAIRNTMNPTGQDYGPSSGTSMATPYVAGLAALLVSQQPARRPADIESILSQGVDDLGTPGFDAQFGYGRINALRALGLNLPLPSPTPTVLGTPVPTPVPTPTASLPAAAPQGVPGGLVLDID
ncbi:MAG: S8 family peptidase [Candidatus Sericytochromatia bacterium]